MSEEADAVMDMLTAPKCQWCDGHYRPNGSTLAEYMEPGMREPDDADKPAYECDLCGSTVFTLEQE